MRQPGAKKRKKNARPARSAAGHEARDPLLIRYGFRLIAITMVVTVSLGNVMLATVLVLFNAKVYSYKYLVVALVPPVDVL